jgi:hypothetical protein
MSLLTYINQPIFNLHVRQELRKWYRSFDGVDFWEFIRQNIDRECVRDDIDTAKWDQFLHDVALRFGAHPYPLDAIKSVIDGKSTFYFLPGRQFTPRAEGLYRYMGLDQFMKHNYRGRVITRDMRTLKALIDKRYITGTDMEGTIFGKQMAGRNYAVWCADDSLASETQGDKVRDQLGLKHIAGGYLVEIAYPLRLLESRNMKVCPPTVPDAFAEGADNWIWVKNRNSGGPGWGYTVDMSSGGAGAEGVPEALHEPFTVAPSEGASIRLRALNPFSKTPPQMDHSAMLGNVNL